MRPLFASLALLSLATLAACDSSKPPAATKPADSKPAASAPAVTAPKPAKTATSEPAATPFPALAKPMLGTWAKDLANCDDPASVLTVTRVSYAAPDRQCDMKLDAVNNGGFRLDCGGALLTLVPVFAPTGEGINVTVGDGKRQTYLRCGK